MQEKNFVAIQKSIWQEQMFAEEISLKANNNGDHLTKEFYKGVAKGLEVALRILRENLQ